jgi:peptidoglycan DL-endopeptidase CwlO
MAADPATVAMIAKAAIALATDKRTWTVIGSIIAALLTPFILLVICLLSFGSEGQENNRNAIRAVFEGQKLPEGLDKEYISYLSDMADNFQKLDDAVASLGDLDEGEVDVVFAKSVFYSLYFGSESLDFSESQYRDFARCFIHQEDREVIEDNSKKMVTITVATQDMGKIYARLSVDCGIAVSSEDIANAMSVWSIVRYGVP